MKPSESIKKRVEDLITQPISPYLRVSYNPTPMEQAILEWIDKQEEVNKDLIKAIRLLTLLHGGNHLVTKEEKQWLHFDFYDDK